MSFIFFITRKDINSLCNRGSYEGNSAECVHDVLMIVLWQTLW